MWVVYALLSALFASATSVLAKVGIRDIGSNLATAVRTIVVLALAWGMVFVSGQQQDMHRLTPGKQSALFNTLWFGYGIKLVILLPCVADCPCQQGSAH